MSKIYGMLVIALCLLSTGSAEARKLREPYREVFKNNADCVLNDSCDLKEFYINVSDFVLDFQKQGLHYGTKAIFGYRTEKVDTLEKYSVVQFVRGCAFEYILTGDRAGEKLFNQPTQFGKK